VPSAAKNERGSDKTEQMERGGWYGCGRGLWMWLPLGVVDMGDSVHDVTDLINCADKLN